MEHRGRILQTDLGASLGLNAGVVTKVTGSRCCQQKHQYPSDLSQTPVSCPGLLKESDGVGRAACFAQDSADFEIFTLF